MVKILSERQHMFEVVQNLLQQNYQRSEEFVALEPVDYIWLSRLEQGYITHSQSVYEANCHCPKTNRVKLKNKLFALNRSLPRRVE